MSEDASPNSAENASPAPSRGEIDQLRTLIRRLRAPGGCPWDQKQSLDDVRAYLLEEAHETASAITSGDREELASELGDLFFQAVFVAVLGEEESSFDLADVIDGVHAKMVERHPHVFGDQEKLADADAVAKAWEQRKVRRRGSLLDGVPASLPALLSAYRITQKAAGVGFDWPSIEPVLDKVREELAEVEAELDRKTRDQEAVRGEIGDLLFAVVNLARHAGVDPEGALAGCNAKFRRRFASIEEDLAASGRTLADSDLEEMDALWNAAKAREAET